MVKTLLNAIHLKQCKRIICIICVLFCVINLFLIGQVSAKCIPPAPPAAYTVNSQKGVVTLTASGSTGVYNWYAGFDDGNPLGSGVSFTTPFLDKSTTYFVSALNGPGCESSRTTVTITISDNITGEKHIGGHEQEWQEHPNDSDIYYNAGKVGIGLMNPTEALDIFGNLKLSGNIISPNFSTTGTATTIKNLAVPNHIEIGKSIFLEGYNGVNTFTNNIYTDNNTTSSDNALYIQSKPGFTNNTVINNNIGLVGIGGAPVSGFKLAVTGNTLIGSPIIPNMTITALNSSSSLLCGIASWNNAYCQFATAKDAVITTTGTGAGNLILSAGGPGNGGAIRFGTGLAGNEKEYMTIANTGHVGIGTPNPSEALEINGNLKVNGTINATTIQQGGQAITSSQWLTNGTGITYNGKVGIGYGGSPYYNLEVIGDNAHPDPAIYVAHSGIGELTMGIATYEQDYSTNSKQGDAVISTRGTFGKSLLLTSLKGTISFSTGVTSAGLNAERMTILNNGNVGIGTKIPGQALEVNGNVAISQIGANGLLKITASSTDGTINSETCLKAIISNNKSESQIQYRNRFVLHDVRNSIQNPLEITYDGAIFTSQFKGNLGIDGNIIIGSGPVVGTKSKLAVDGLISAREILVTPGDFPDYVFAPKYQLQPLKDLQKYIAINHHLPNIPTANEVEKNGLAVGELEVKLLEKVEELTLYIIELNKKIEILERR